MIELRYRSVDDLNRKIVEWVVRQPRNVSLVVGIPRSGCLAASLLALHLHVPLVDLPTFLQGRQSWSGFRGESGASHGRVILVDDSVDSGREMTRVKDAVAARMSEKSGDIVYLAVYATSKGRGMVDEWLECVPQPRAFEWNILQHREVLSHTCMDIDGVLCRDPTDAENDDGARYGEFLRCVTSTYTPNFQVHQLVTSRLEKYRALTEDWLAEHGVPYGDLVMLDLESAEERRRLGAHAGFKAAVYRESDDWLFVESDPTQSRDIFDLTGRPVFCFRTREYFGRGASPEHSEPMSSRFGRLRRSARVELKGIARSIDRRLSGSVG